MYLPHLSPGSQAESASVRYQLEITIISLKKPPPPSCDRVISESAFPRVSQAEAADLYRQTRPEMALSSTLGQYHSVIL
jgi:hypothetical protein